VAYAWSLVGWFDSQRFQLSAHRYDFIGLLSLCSKRPFPFLQQVNTACTTRVNRQNP
ncbi:MAG: hypothetical protein ACI8XV_002698, partial [Arenicella sp.]